MGQRGRNGKRDGDNLQSQHDKAQYQRGLEHPDREQVGKDTHAAGCQTLGDQHRQGRQRCQRRRLHSGKHSQPSAAQLGLPALGILAGDMRFFPTGKRHGCLHAQHGAEGKLKADIAGRVRVLQTQQNGRRTREGEQVDGLIEPISQQHQQKDDASPQNRDRQAGKQHVKHGYRRPHKDQRPIKPTATTKREQPAQQRQMQARYGQQVRDARRAEGILHGVRQGRLIP